MITAQEVLKDIPAKKYRLITRSDMDGLVCGVLLKELNLIDEITFAHPKDMQDGIIEVTSNDITTNLPYVEGVYTAFDHHDSEEKRLGTDEINNHIIDVNAPSAARVVYDYFGGKDTFSNVSEEMMIAVDKADAAQFTRDDVLNPQGWELLSFLMDARTGLGRFRDFSISNYELMMKLIDFCRDHHDIKDILALPDVKERVDLFMEHKEKFEDQVKRCTTVYGPLAVIDLRDEESIWPGNRFVIYAMFPETNISCHVLWGKQKQNTVFAFGKSIFDRSSPIHIGDLMLAEGGGGHAAAGTCQVPNDDAESILKDLVDHIKSHS